jgi:archaellum component FlaC
MVRTDLIYSCARQHNIDIKNLVFKDDTYRTLNKTFDLQGLESSENIDIISKMNQLREKYNYLKNELNQYKLRHQLFNKTTENKEKYLEGISELDNLDVNTPFENIYTSINNSLNKINDLKNLISDFKNTTTNDLNNFNSNIPSTIKTNVIENIFIGYVKDNWQNYDKTNQHCYINLPIDPNEYIIYTILETPNVDLGYKVIGINSIYPFDGFSRIYLYKTSASEAISNNYTVWYLAIKKDKNAY